MMNENYITKLFNLDVAAFIAMLMVVNIHSVILTVDVPKWFMFLMQTLSNGISRVAVPFFFIRAGFLFFRNTHSYKDCFFKIPKRFGSLVIPYLFWVFAGLLLLYLTNKFSLGAFINTDLSQMNFNDVTEYIFHNPINYQLWFLRDLFCLVLLSPLLYILINKIPILTICFLSISYFSGLYDVPILYSDYSLFFFIMGGCFNRNTFNPWYYNIPVKLLIPFFITGVLLLAYLYVWNHLVLYTFRQLFLLVGVISFWYTLRYVPDNVKNYRYAFIFKHGFFLFLVHEPLLTAFKKIYLHYLYSGSITELLVLYLIFPILLSVLLLSLGHLLNIKFPWLYNFLTGSRGK